ncbi:MAG TPA: YdcF family protein [Candidatus Limnocylindrales bacterium]|nr:YdcF family protein [Candidatus Limnocylindrales bacterium]
MRRELIRLALVALGGVLVVTAYATVRIWEQGDRDEQRPADAIVVLGAAQYDGRPSPVFRARLEHAVSLYQQGLAPLLVVTGGKAAGDRTTEAAVARAFAIANDVPVDAILVEDRGRNTLDSLRTVGSMLHKRGLSSAVFVSDRTHMLRVLRIARDQDITAWGSPTETSPTDTDRGRRVDATLHELAALAAYFVGGVGDPEPPTAAGR